MVAVQLQTGQDMHDFARMLCPFCRFIVMVRKRRRQQDHGERLDFYGFGFVAWG